MRIALDGSDLAAGRFEGPSVYAGELLPRLTRILSDRDHVVTTYLPGALHEANIAGEAKVIPGKPYWTQRYFANALRKDKPDVLFMPIQMLPLRLPKSIATVSVVHDLEYLRHPKTYTFLNRTLLKWFTSHAVKNATRIITVSQYTKDDVARVYKRPQDHITVVHHGVDPRCFTPEAPNSKSEIRNEEDKIQTRHSLPKRFILYVGALQPRKNVIGLLKAYEQLEKEGVSDVGLVLVSGGGWKQGPIVECINALAKKNQVRLLRKVSEEDLAYLYRMSSVFVLPSFSEGFGMPILEAMSCGAPVITSNTSSLPEVAGDAALLVDPNNPKEITKAMAQVLTNDTLRTDLIQKGKARAKQFSWDETARKTADVIEEAGKAPNQNKFGSGQTKG